MLFSSSVFLFYFLPTVIVTYYIISNRFRNSLLLFASLFFYAYGEPKFVLVMVFSIGMNYLFALLISRYRDSGSWANVFLAITVVFNIGILFIFKYLNFFIKNVNYLFENLIPQTSIVLPIGISFFTFQALSYVIDVYRGHGDVQHNPLNVALYISFFPQLIAGPIVRYETIAMQIRDRDENWTDFCLGARRFIAGLCKKIIIANNLAIVADKAFAIPFSDLSALFAWLGVLCYAFQIYYDFSGYSDMAIGLGKMFGFHFLENFSYPYYSKSITEFWRRWHISLGTWFRDYLYFPLGGSRVRSKSRHILNLFIVWFLTGFWHGASWNFVVWGLFYFVLLVLEKFLIHPEKMRHQAQIASYRMIVLCLVGIGWVFFRSAGLKEALRYCMCMFGISGNGFTDASALFYLRENRVFLLVAAFLSVPTLEWVKSKLSSRKYLSGILEFFHPLLYFGLFLIAISYLVIGSHNPFIYFDF